ncbi:MAG: nucleotidyltransferase [Clostridia bacterium]|nr:nucleotidyltransferase [Clostridia bacterium]
MDKTLVIMAAGMGSRYGSLKQIDPIGEEGSLIIDYSIYDAVKAGFNKVVFIIKKQDEEAFKNAIGNRIEDKVKTEYVFQDINNIPEGYSVPEGRVKPWGTGHAILSCLGTVKEPFAVINSDDYYGPQAFKEAAEWIERTDFDNEILPFSMVGFQLKNTLTENGHVSRGVCVVDENGKLSEITERTKIIRRGEKVFYEDEETPVELDENSIVSMNCWCFAPQMLDRLQARFDDFFKTVEQNPMKAEFFLPFVVSDMLEDKECTVDVLTTTDKWFGVTYKEDRPLVVESIKAMKDEGKYPQNMLQWK